MPNYAHLKTNLNCTRCGTVVYDLFWFQWGYCHARIPVDAYFYQLGDAIRWRECSESLIPAWVYFNDEDPPSANIGDHTIHDLLIQDTELSWNSAQQPRCSMCNQLFGGAMLEIRGGIIQRAWLYQPGEFDQFVDIYLIADGGSVTPMQEWNDHPMDRVIDCSLEKHLISSIRAT